MGDRMKNLNTERGQSGFSLIEMLLAITIGSLVAGVATAGLYTTMHVANDGSQSLERSNAAFLTSSRFASDVVSVGPVTGVAEMVSTGEVGCGGEQAILRLIGPGPVGGDAVRVRSYSVVSVLGESQLRRSTCSGVTLDAALAASPSPAPVVRKLVTEGPAPVVVTCNGDAEFSRCRTVEMSVRTTTSRYFTVRGTVGSVLVPTPTTTPTLAVAPPTGKCTIMASETTWGATGGAAGGSGDLHANDTLLYTYNDTNQRNSFLRFDLTQPCGGAGDSWRTLPGGRNLTAVSLKMAYVGKTNSSCWIFPGVSKDEQIMQPLDTNSLWSEATLRGSNMPGAVRSGNDYKFKVAEQGSLTTHTGTGLTATVRQWYASGGWRNNGWILRRDGVGDTCGNSNMFASRSHADANLRPRLEITWG